MKRLQVSEIGAGGRRQRGGAGPVRRPRRCSTSPTAICRRRSAPICSSRAWRSSMSDDAVRGHKSRGAKGDYTETAALTQILQRHGLHDADHAVERHRHRAAAAARRRREGGAGDRSRRAAPPPQQTGLETVVVTAQKKSEDIQTVPIAITALSQQQLTDRQIAGGPDLVKEVPNMTFTKTNFSGYNIEIRGIGTQAISVTTDPAVAVAFNDIPFIRNHFFEQEFYDRRRRRKCCADRRARSTAAMRRPASSISNRRCRPITYEAMLSADIGNYSNRRFEGMLNIPIVGDTARSSASPANGPSATAIPIDTTLQHARRRPRSVVGPHDHRLEADLELADLSRLGAFLRRRRSPAQRQAALQDRAIRRHRSNVRRCRRSAADDLS